MEKKIEYLYASIADIGSTIRAIDTKVSYLLIILFIPLTKLHAIYSTLKPLIDNKSHLLGNISGILIFIFVLSWVIAFWCAMKTIIAIDDPKQHIDGEKPESQFFPAYLFQHEFWHIIGLSKGTSKTQFNKHYEKIPDQATEIAKQLTLEQMKTMYIASLKIKRSACAYYCAIVWVSIGGILWFLNLLFV
jgi:hypothetical protein